MQNKFAPISTSSLLQLGQNFGGFISCEFSYSSLSPNTSGITSLLRLIKTRELSFSFFLVISPILLSVALVMVAPLNSTGSRTAIGVIFPVLPTCHTTSVSIVVTSSASNLYAIAKRGNFIVCPNFFCTEISFILSTIPSIKNGKSCFILSTRSISALISSKLEYNL